MKLFKLLYFSSFALLPLAPVEANEYKFKNIKYDQFKEEQNTYQPKDKFDEYIIKGATYSTKFVPLMNSGAEGSEYTG
ncbi:MAG: adhesin, partial [Prochlorococcus marinus XMU1428]|nr:adhesin [Prochlorococcus marinus XMU1428]